MKKKLLCTILKERTDTIEYRKIRSNLMVQAQNNRNCFFIIAISEKTKLMLQNEGLIVEKVIDGTPKYKISW